MRTFTMRGAAFRLAAMLALTLALAPQSWPAREAAAADVEVAAYRRAVEQRFAQWLQQLWPEAEAAGVSRATFDANLNGLKLYWSLPHLVLPDPAAPGGPPLPTALAQATTPRHQPEFDIPANYFKDSTLNALAATGRAKLAAWRPTL